MRTIDIILFDKTGTLTEGAHAVTGVAAASKVPEEDVLALASAAEINSEHPVARAIVAAAAAHPVASQSPRAGSDFRSAAGRGVQATVDGKNIMVGGPNMLLELGVDSPDSLHDKISTWTSRGTGVLHVLRNKEVIGAIAVEDQIRPESRDAVRALQDAGVKVALITGDASQVAESVAQELGIDEVFAEVLPQDKTLKSLNCRNADSTWPWSAMASMTRLPWHGPILASLSARAQM